MKFKRIFVALCLGILALQAIGCGDKAAKKVASEAPRDGRDRELYADSLRALQRHRYEEGRLLLNTLISTYDGSKLLPIAKLLIADSFFREGGTSNLNQAEVEYREWLQFFPNHPLADDVLIKIADIHIKQIGPSNQDWTQARSADRELNDLVKRFPATRDNLEVQQRITFVREQLGSHELNIMRFYFKNRKAWNGVIQRGLSIVKKYPDFSHLDETLYLLGLAYMEKEDTPEAGKYLARLVREFPNSEYRDKAAEILERFGVAVPEPDPNAKERLVARQGAIKALMTEVFGPVKRVSSEGIILNKGDEINPEVAAQFNIQDFNLVTPEATLTDQKGVKSLSQKETPKVADATATDKPAQKTENTPKVKTSDKDKKKKAKVFGRG